VINGKSSQGEACYRYIFVCYDNIFVIAEAPQEIITTIAKFYRLKDGSIGEPKYYLGAQAKKHTIPAYPPKPVWALSTEKYVM
jgi:hypothetical protein